MATRATMCTGRQDDAPAKFTAPLVTVRPTIRFAGRWLTNRERFDD